MSTHVVRLPDVGEGVAEAELVSWHIAVGDHVTPESVLAEVLTDKATVEVSSPVSGTVRFLRGEVGDVLAVGSDFVGIDTGGAPDADDPAVAQPDMARATPAPTPDTPVAAPSTAASPEPAGAAVDGVASARAVARPAPARPAADRTGGSSRATAARTAASAAADGRTGESPRAFAGGRPVAAPAVRQRAGDLGVDLRLVRGSGPAQRITHADLDAYLAGETAQLGVAGGAPATSGRRTEQVPIVGLRRRIAERMSTSASRIPHITYVDEVDVGELEELRHGLNATYPDHARLTLLPFLIRAIVLAVDEQPHLNATFDDEAGVLVTSGPVHIGIATQTPNGLLVPVVRDAQTLDLWQAAGEIARVSAAARASKATRDELSGSTITITSLGALGGLVTTPIINHPEVAIVGVNKIQVRPLWDGTVFVPRTMMNLSSSFDHRIVDGWDAATFVQRIKALLEAPALLFVGRPGSG